MKLSIALMFMTISLGLPAFGEQKGGLFRHVLGCLEEGNLLENELFFDRTSSSIGFKQNGVLKYVGKDPLISNAAGGTFVSESAQKVALGIFSSLRLSNGRYYSTGPFGFIGASLDRVSYSYGIGGNEVFQPGWGYIFAVPDELSPGAFKIVFKQSKTPPASAHRYIGSFYLKLNPTCVGQPTTGTGECSLTPTLPPDCVGPAHNCPINYGRLVGVDLLKGENRYYYRIPAEVGCVGSNCSRITNLNPLAVEYSIQNASTGATVELDTDGIVVEIQKKNVRSVPVLEGGISVTSPNYSDVYLMGHKEEISLYE